MIRFVSDMANPHQVTTVSLKGLYHIGYSDGAYHSTVGFVYIFLTRSAFLVFYSLVRQAANGLALKKLQIRRCLFYSNIFDEVLHRLAMGVEKKKGYWEAGRASFASISSNRRERMVLETSIPGRVRRT